MCAVSILHSSTDCPNVQSPTVGIQVGRADDPASTAADIQSMLDVSSRDESKAGGRLTTPFRRRFNNYVSQHMPPTHACLALSSVRPRDGRRQTQRCACSLAS